MRKPSRRNAAAEIAEFKSRIRAITRESGIEHATIEVETTGAECCPPGPRGARTRFIVNKAG